MKPFQKIGWAGVILAVAFFWPKINWAQQDSLQFYFTTSVFRADFYDALVKHDINKNLDSDLRTEDGRYDFRSAFWPMELIGYKSPFVKKQLAYAFSEADHCSISFRRGLLEVVYTNWLNVFDEQVAQMMGKTRHPKIFAMCAEYLRAGDKRKEYKAAIQRLLKDHFPKHRENPILKMLSQRIFSVKQDKMPSLAELFSPQFAPGLTVMFSFQRPDRRYPGRVIVRKPDGSFVLDSSGKTFSVGQLALSVSNLPFYLANGNTPQGIYRLSGFDVSNSRFIGPTENIQMSLPFEIPVDSFFITPLPGMDTQWNLKKYRALLPPAWHNYNPVYQGFYAGKAGRNAIIAHGTAIDPEYYKGTTYFPETPSLGCLCTFESWSELGYRQRSDQQALVDAMKKAGNGIGYAVVLDLEDKKEAVTDEEVESLVQENSIPFGGAP